MEIYICPITKDSLVQDRLVPEWQQCGESEKYLGNAEKSGPIAVEAAWII
jgi:hypothetical protein